MGTGWGQGVITLLVVLVVVPGAVSKVDLVCEDERAWSAKRISAQRTLSAAAAGPPAHQVLLFCPKAKPESFCPALAVLPRLISRLPAKATPC